MTQEETKIKNQRIVIIALLLIIFTLALSGMFVFKAVNNEPPQTTMDSLNIIRSIEKKQAGKEIAILLNEVTKLQKEKAKDKAEKDSIKAHEKSLIATNTYLIKRMRETAPKECQSYIDSTDAYHKQIEAVKDSAYDKQADELCNAEEQNEKLMKIIGIQKMEAVKDSTNHADNMKLKDAEVKKLERKAKQERNGKRAAIGVGVVMFLIWLGVQVGG